MPTYAVLGATGSTGQAILNILLQSPKNTVNAYVRSKAKLLKLSPSTKAMTTSTSSKEPLTMSRSWPTASPTPLQCFLP